jgi:hypothetical protein
MSRSRVTIYLIGLSSCIMSKVTAMSVRLRRAPVLRDSGQCRIPEKPTLIANLRSVLISLRYYSVYYFEMTCLCRNVLLMKSTVSNKFDATFSLVARVRDVRLSTGKLSLSIYTIVRINVADWFFKPIESGEIPY